MSPEQTPPTVPGLNLLLVDREGALVRLLGLVERRGFRLGAINTRATPQGTRLSLTLASDDRPAEVLLRQVARLHDVLEAALDIQRPPHTTARDRVEPRFSPSENLGSTPTRVTARVAR